MRVYDSRARAWSAAEQYGHDGQAWVHISQASRIGGEAYQSIFSPNGYLGAGTVLQRDVTNMPLDTRSEEMAVAIDAVTPFSPGGAWGAKTSLNTSSYGTQPIHAYLVNSDEMTSRRVFRGSVSIGIRNIPGETETLLDGPIPLEPWMVPAQNGDRGLAVYDTATGIMREYFDVDSRGEVWKGTGGYSQNTPGLENLAEDNYALQQRRGLSNVAGMHNSLGFIGIQEALLKRVNHALCVTAATTYMRVSENGGEPVVSWPARGADGKLERYLPGGVKYEQGQKYTGPFYTPVHGQWGRVKASVDPMHNPKTGRPYPEFTRVLIEAAKTYGLVFTDTNLWCHAFNAEQGRSWAHVYGEDPWKRMGVIHRQYVSRRGEDGFSTTEFPWDQTEWAPVDWGRPDPDWNLRPQDTGPWTESELGT